MGRRAGTGVWAAHGDLDEAAHASLAVVARQADDGAPSSAARIALLYGLKLFRSGRNRL